ncbi:hypothetical protein DSL92_00335 [Billgrantia gudaonensis]|uniref:Uncharacterized protein n=1 Tax=Billgrantia gudaonensis TaxID=376427 RepID=A0A432JL08_9GAMM|nr:hypothetical protein DSL92_00335 [Halomonas gudaonensis]
MSELGQLDLWRIAMRPGKATGTGDCHASTKLAKRGSYSPGNPVSTVGGWLFLRPLLGALLGCPSWPNCRRSPPGPPSLPRPGHAVTSCACASSSQRGSHGVRLWRPEPAVLTSRIEAGCPGRSPEHGR